MDLSAIPLFSMLKGRLGYLNQRERVIAQNVANADTPGYRPSDLKPFSFAEQVKAQGSLAMMQPVRTSAAHMTPSTPKGSGWRPKITPDSETTLDGNQVVLEEQMMKMTEARMNYDAAVGFYQKSMNLLRTAARAPGR